MKQGRAHAGNANGEENGAAVVAAEAEWTDMNWIRDDVCLLFQFKSKYTELDFIHVND